MARRILYFNHDIAQARGGIRTIYSHVACLNRNGLPAWVVHGKPGFRLTWFEHDAPVLYYGDGFRLEPDDIVVVPEDLPILEQMSGAPVKKIVFCQNHFYSFMALRSGQSWRNLGVTHVMAASEPISQFLQEDLGWESAPVVHYAIDPTIYQPAPKKLQIACMPRKRPDYAEFIRRLCLSWDGPIGQTPWAMIDGVSATESARALSQSAIFLSLSRLEGFGLPPLEAMASGCIVVGYHGYGGREFTRPDNGFWLDNEDPILCARQLREVVKMYADGDASLQAVVNRARQKAAEYSPARQEAELIAFFKKVISD